MNDQEIKQDMPTLRDCKEEWASEYGKTWEEVQRDFEYGLGISKILDFEQVMDRVAELYRKQHEAILKPDIVQELAKLPQLVTFDGIDFQLSIYLNKPEDMRICYAGGDDLIWSDWINPFTESLSNHLYQRENIATEEDLREAIADCREFLISNNIWKP